MQVEKEGRATRSGGFTHKRRGGGGGAAAATSIQIEGLGGVASALEELLGIPSFLSSALATLAVVVPLALVCSPCLCGLWALGRLGGAIAAQKKAHKMD